MTSGDLTSGTSYTITTRAGDNASPVNDEGFASSITFTWDTAPPLTAFQKPSAGGLYLDRPADDFRNRNG